MSQEPLGNGQVRLDWRQPTAHLGLGCALELQGKVTSVGQPDGAAVLISTRAHVDLPNAPRRFLGAAASVAARADSYPTAPGEPREEHIVVVVPVSAEALNRLEELRAGEGLALHVVSTLVLVGAGPLKRALASTRESEDPLRLEKTEWQAILQQWGRGAAIPLFVPLLEVVSGEDQRTVVARLVEAQQKMNDGQYKESVQASREAVEVLRRLSPAKAPLPKDSRQRDLEERRHAILDALAGYVKALFDYDSAAAHSDPHLRAIAWRRENALLSLATAAAAAQRIMADG